MIDSVNSFSCSQAEQSTDVQKVCSPASKGISHRFSSIESLESRNNVGIGCSCLENIKRNIRPILNDMRRCFEKIKSVFISKKEENTPPPREGGAEETDLQLEERSPLQGQGSPPKEGGAEETDLQLEERIPLQGQGSPPREGGAEEADLQLEERSPLQGQGSPLERLADLLQAVDVSREAVSQSFGLLEPGIQDQIKESMREAIARDFLGALITPTRERYLQLEQHEIPNEHGIIERSFDGRLEGNIEGLEDSIADEKIRDVLSSDSLFRTVLAQMDGSSSPEHRAELLELLNKDDVTLEEVRHLLLNPTAGGFGIVLPLATRMAKELFLLNTIAKATRLIESWITSEAVDHIITGQDLPQINIEDLHPLLPVRQRACPNYYPPVLLAYRAALEEFSPSAVHQILLSREGPRAYFANAVNALQRENRREESGCNVQ